MLFLVIDYINTKQIDADQINLLKHTLDGSFIALQWMRIRFYPRCSVYFNVIVVSNSWSTTINLLSYIVMD